MSRARMVKPEFFDDSKMGKLSRDARLLFIGLWTLGDDVGNVQCDPVFVRSRLFPYDELALDDVERLLGELVVLERLVIYEREGEHYAHIRRFLEHQTISHPSKWRNPGPGSDNTQPCDCFAPLQLTGQNPNRLQELWQESCRAPGGLPEGSRLNPNPNPKPKPNPNPPAQAARTGGATRASGTRTTTEGQSIGEVLKGIEGPIADHMRRKAAEGG